MNRIYRKLPNIIQTILLISEGWLVGSSIEKILNNENFSDFDIIVPNREKYQLACKLLHSQATEVFVNSFGGLKFILANDSIDIDIWCEELDHFVATANKLDYIYNMKKNIMLKNYKE